MGFWSDTFGGGNSFSESLANVTTPGDDYEYRGGTLYGKDNKAVDYNPDTGKYGGAGAPSNLGAMDSKSTDAYSYNLNQGNAGTTPLGSNATSDRGGLANGLGAITRRPSTMASLGLMAGGIPGAIMAGTIAAGSRNRYNQKNPAFPIDRTLKADPEFRKKAAAQEFSRDFGRLGKEGRSFTSAQLKQIREDPKGRIEGAFFKDGDTSKQFKMNMFGNTYEINPETGNSKLIEDQAAAAGGEGGVAAVRPVGTQATVPTGGLPAISAMSEAAASGAFMPIPDPNYDPNDPMSSKYIINPTYDQIAEYQKSILGMARGGEVESALGGNEKDLINDAEKAIRGELDETRAAIILAQYVQQYGEGALMNLVDSVRTGEADETRAQFASGKNGMVRGNGDGSGVDDMVTAQLKDGDATQDVLLADGEFVMRKDATDSLQKAYGDDMLDKINDAGPNAAAALKKYLTG
jgi:hypothetical protein